MTILCLISGLISLALWLAAGAGAAHLAKAAWARLAEQVRELRQPRSPQIYVMWQPMPPAPAWPTQELSWPPPLPEDRYIHERVQYGARQPQRAIESTSVVFDATVPSGLANYEAGVYLDEALAAAGPHATQVRLRRGRSTAMDALARAAQVRGLRVHWVGAAAFEDAGWVIERD